MIPTDLKYTNDHEWVRVEGGIATVGITAFAQEQLGDIVFIEVPEVGRTLTAGETFGVAESVKTVSDLFAPVSGEVLSVNPKLDEANDDFNPALVNEEPYGEGWMITIRMSCEKELEKLLNSDDYKKITEEA